MLCRAAAKHGKRVLHLDPAGYYGSKWASFQLDSFLDWTAQQRSTSEPERNCKNARHSISNGQAATGSVDTSETEHTSAETVAASMSPKSSPLAAVSGESQRDSGPPHGRAEASLESAQQQQALQIPMAGHSSPLNTNVEVFRAADADLGSSRDYNIDMAPRVSHPSANSSAMTSTWRFRLPLL